MKKFALIFALATATIVATWAIPASNKYVARKMADGSTAMVRLAGDEFFSYMVTADGIVVAEQNGLLVPTGMLQQDITPRYVANKRKMSKLISHGQPRRVAKTASGAYTRNLVILVNFSDQSFSYPKSEFQNMLNQQGYSQYGATGSIRQYFADNSNGQFNPQFDVYGPYTLDNNTAFYGAESGGSSDVRPAQMVLDAVRKLAADTSAHINFADYDGDNDDEIDNVFIYYAGCGENYAGNSSDYVWPHRWVVYTGNTDAYSTDELIFDGKRLYNYGCTSELSGYYESAHLCGIGAFCHEFSHLLGLMDLYVTDYSSDHKTMGEWDIMCNGPYNNNEHTPAGYSTFERFALGWINPPVISTQSSFNIDYTLSSHEGYIITNTGNFNYDFENPVPSEYFVIENRQQVSWDTYLPGHGMLIEKVNWDLDNWLYNIGNNDPNNMLVDIIEAGGSTVAEGHASDPFPGTYHIDSYTPYRSYPITNITENGTIISFDVKGGAPKGPFIVAFDDRGLGVADTTTITERYIYAGVTLPNVTPDSSYEFLGWCTSITGNSTEIFTAGSLYKPARNTILFAVYKQNGRVVEDYYGNCLSERFSKLGSSQGLEITGDIDFYSDTAGWISNSLHTNIGMLQVGTDDERGYLLTPELPLQGDVEVTCIISQESSSYIGIIGNDGVSSEYPLARKGANIIRVTLNNLDPESRIEFISDNNSFSIGGIYICGDAIPAPVAVEQVAASDQPVILRDKVVGGKVRIEGLREGMRVMVVDGMGRTLMTRDAENDTMEFDAPETVYFVKIL